MTRTAATRDSGIAVRLMNVVRTFQRNRNRTTVTMTPPSTQGGLDVADGALDEVGLAEGRRVDAYVRRQARAQGGERLLDPARHLEGVGVRLLLDGGHHGRRAR